ncbi:MAG TPA: hypothetical protein VK934_08510 [Fimbriimonas sp.]|nr:hypothetical protein [Fimbriimonas sp.]
MLGLIIYLVVTVVAGFILSFFWLTFRSTKKRGDHSPYLTIFICMVLTTIGPFIFVELLTKVVGKDMEKAIKSAYHDGPIDGKMEYYKVRWYTGKSAQALAVGTERAQWGGTDRPVMGINLEKGPDGKWFAESYKLIYSDRRNKDGFVIPPYR